MKQRKPHVLQRRSNGVEKVCTIKDSLACFLLFSAQSQERRVQESSKNRKSAETISSQLVANKDHDPGLPQETRNK